MQQACSVETAVVCRRDVVSQERFGSAARVLLESGRASPRSKEQRESMIVGQAPSSSARGMRTLPPGEERRRRARAAADCVSSGVTLSATSAWP